MAYSSIIKKPCKCGCGKMPSVGYNGYYYSCNPEMMRIKIAKHKEKQKNQTQCRSLIHTRGNIETKETIDLNHWFEERRGEMTGCCVECGKTTNKKNDRYYRWSVCHIVPKSLIKSVATNEFNFIELCQLHHQEYDNTFDRAAKMMCFGEIKNKFQLFKHLIPTPELKKVNPHLLN